MVPIMSSVTEENSIVLTFIYDVSSASINL